MLFFFILVTYLVDILLILWGEILSWSLIGIIGLINMNKKPTKKVQLTWSFLFYFKSLSTIRIVLSIRNSCATCSIGPAGYVVIMILSRMVPWEFTVVTWPRTQQNKLATVPLLLIYNMVELDVIPQEKNCHWVIFFLTLPKFSYLKFVWKNAIKICIGHRTCSRV